MSCVPLVGTGAMKGSARECLRFNSYRPHSQSKRVGYAQCAEGDCLRLQWFAHATMERGGRLHASRVEQTLRSGYEGRR